MSSALPALMQAKVAAVNVSQLIHTQKQDPAQKITQALAQPQATALVLDLPGSIGSYPLAAAIAAACAGLKPVVTVFSGPDAWIGPDAMMAASGSAAIFMAAHWMRLGCRDMDGVNPFLTGSQLSWQAFADAVCTRRGLPISCIAALKQETCIEARSAVQSGLIRGISEKQTLMASLLVNPYAFGHARGGGPKSPPAASAVSSPVPSTLRYAETPAAPVPQSREQMAEDAKAYAKKHSVSFVDAIKALGMDGPAPAATAQRSTQSPAQRRR